MRANSIIVSGTATAIWILVAQVGIFVPLVQGIPCDDLSGWKTKRGKKCRFVLKKPSKRCNSWGTTTSGDSIRANIACKRSCRTCSCEDSDTWVYKHNNKLRGCDFVSRKKKRCNKEGVDGTKAKTGCPISCNACLSDTAPSSSPSKLLTQDPTSSPSKLLTQDPTSSPTTTTTDRPTGHLCTNGSQCLSGVCQRGTCYASNLCSAIKQQEGVAFASKMIVLVFVGSGFNNQEDWQQQVIQTYSTFRQYDMLDDGVQLFNAFSVDVLEDSFCYFGCAGIDRLLCCDVNKAKALASKCFSSQATLQTIVIHNDDKYGGAGYSSSNVATTSTHPSAGKVAVHELGHSLYELADEYTSGVGTVLRANCDVAGCPKWSDLSDHMGSNLCIGGACRQGDYYASAYTFMWYLNYPVGEVNLRFTCCTYLALTTSIPSYCDKFEFGEGLINYCKRDYQGYGDIYETVSTGKESRDEDYPFKLKYMSVVRPMLILINVKEETFIYLEQHDSGSTPYRRSQVCGDYPSTIAAKNAGANEVLKVTITFESSPKQEIIFNASRDIHVPPGEDERVSTSEASYTTSTVEVVVDGGKGQVTHVAVELKHVSTIFL